MKFDRYEIEAEKSYEVYEFVSEGINGKINKVVQYSVTNLKDYYNLGFGDKNEITGGFDDNIISNNGDAQKVLSTVVSTLFLFTENFPERWVFATGSSKARTRLYRMGISNNLIEIEEHFHIFGLKNGDWKIFEKGTDYDGFVVKRKSKNS